LENIPETGPALIVYYHGTLPIDVYYLLAKCILYKGRMMRCVGDKFLFKIPGWQIAMKVFCVTPGSVSSCVEDLEKGHLLCISPGGVREALFSDSDRYDLLWGKRVGFAKIALQAKVPVIPMFTENCREAFRTPSTGRRFFRWLYEKTRLPLVPIYGGFPVKLRTYVGRPLPYPGYGAVNLTAEMKYLPITASSGENSGFNKNVRQEQDQGNPHAISPDILARIVEVAIADLIEEHQTLPGSIPRAILDRIPWMRKWTRRGIRRENID